MQSLVYQLYFNKAGLKKKTFQKSFGLKDKKVTLGAVYSLGWEVDGCNNHREEFLQGNKVPLQFDIMVLKCVRDG